MIDSEMMRDYDHDDVAFIGCKVTGVTPGAEVVG